MEQIKLGIIGLGNMGTTHFRNILQDKCKEIKVTAIADLKEERRNAVAQILLEEKADDKVNDISVFKSGEELIKSGKCDSILIAVPHYDHPSLAILAFENGLHVMCEKPAGVYTKQVREMNEAAKKSNLVFGMMFNQRTNHLYRKMRELVTSGDYGQIRRTNWIITNWYRPQFYYDSGAWRATWAGEGGGVLLNQCPHNLDLWQWICGMPKKVQANLHFGKWHDIEVEDDVTAYVEYENGATGVFVTSTGDPCGTNRFEIQMDRAKLVCENDKLEVFELDMSEQEFSASCKQPFASPKATKIEVLTDGKNEQHVGVLNALAGAILRGEPLVANGEEGINGLMLSNAMHLSAFTNSTVDLPFDEDKFLELLNKRILTSKVKKGDISFVASTSDSYNSGSK